MSSETSFIEPFEEYMVSRTGTNRLWARILAIIALGTAIGSNIRIIDKQSPMHLNIFALNVGASGLARKTLPILYYFQPVLERLSRLVGAKMLLPQSFTSEGLHGYFLSNEVVEKEAVRTVQLGGCIVSDEFSRFVKETQKKKYMAGQLEFLSELYDGHIKSRYTKTDKYLQSVEVCVNLIAASTPHLLTVMTEDFYTQGTGNRFLYLYSGQGEIKIENPEEYFMPLGNECDTLLDRFAKKLQAYHENTKNRCLIFSPEASKTLVEYKYEKEKEAANLFYKNQLDIVYSYVTRLPQFCFKIAGLKAIDRTGSRPWSSDIDHAVDVSVEDAHYATKVVDEHFKEFQTIVGLWGKIRREGLAKYRRSDIETIKDVIVSSEDSCIDKTELRRKAYSRGFTPTKFFAVMTQALGSGEVLEGIRRTKTKIAHCYVLKDGFKPEYFEQLPENQETTSPEQQPLIPEGTTCILCKAALSPGDADIAKLGENFYAHEKCCLDHKLNHVKLRTGEYATF
jgi:hypothetical protein